MNALIWKKYIGIKTNKTKTLLFFISPIIYFIILFMYGVQFEIIISFLSLAFTLFTSMIHWNVEDLVYSEALLVTSMDSKKSWRLNYIFISILGNVYAYLVLLVGTLILQICGVIEYHFSSTVFMQNACNIFIGMAILGMGTLQYSDFSKMKQLFTSIFSIMSIVVPIGLVVVGNSIHITKMIIMIELIASILLVLIGEIIVRTASNEKLIFNMQKMVDGYINNIVND